MDDNCCRALVWTKRRVCRRRGRCAKWYGGERGRYGFVHHGYSPGRLTFDWKVATHSPSTYGNEGALELVSNTYDSVARITGETEWAEKSVFLGPGEQNLEWRFSWKYTGYPNSAWVDNMRWEPTPEVSFCEAVDNCDLEWDRGASYTKQWFGQSETYQYGGSAVRSGIMDDGGSTAFSTTVTGPGTLSFLWKVSCEERWDWLELRFGSQRCDIISGETDWQQCSYDIGSGEVIVRWIYVKVAIMPQDRIAVGWIKFSGNLPRLNRNPIHTRTIHGR